MSRKPPVKDEKKTKKCIKTQFKIVLTSNYTPLQEKMKKRIKELIEIFAKNRYNNDVKYYVFEAETTCFIKDVGSFSQISVEKQIL